MKLKPDYFRNIIFGSEDSLVSTLGVLFGIAAGNVDRNTIIFTGFVVIAVEAMSMGAGSFLSETSAKEVNDGYEADARPVMDGVLMFVSYLISGFIPLTPYILFDVGTAMVVSIFASLTALFILGYFPKKNLRGGVRMTTIAGTAILIGYIVAKVFGTYTA